MAFSIPLSFAFRDGSAAYDACRGVRPGQIPACYQHRDAPHVKRVQFGACILHFVALRTALRFVDADDACER
jgi:hypothetical protein